MVKENNFLDGEYHGFAACFKGIQRLNVEKLSLEMWETAPNDPKYENKKDMSINEEMIINGHAVKDEGMNDNIDAVKVGPTLIDALVILFQLIVQYLGPINSNFRQLEDMFQLIITPQGMELVMVHIEVIYQCLKKYRVEYKACYIFLLDTIQL